MRIKTDKVVGSKVLVVEAVFEQVRRKKRTLGGLKHDNLGSQISGSYESNTIIRRKMKKEEEARLDQLLPAYIDWLYHKV